MFIHQFVYIGCHLNLSLEYIMLEHAEFIIKSTSSVHTNPLISTKLCDFGTAEIFKNHLVLNIYHQCYMVIIDMMRDV